MCSLSEVPVQTPGLLSSNFLPAHHEETPKVEVADTVGAGDSFTGSFAAAVLSGMPIAEAYQLAVEVSAYVCTRKGVMPKLPDELLKKVKV